MSPKKKKEKNLDEVQSDKYNDDVIFEEDAEIEQTCTDSAEKVKELKEKLNKCLRENRENLLGWQRSRADFINAKKEFQEKTKQSFAFAKEELIEEILPVVDSFEMAFSNKDAWGNVDEQWRIGVEYIYSQLITVLENNGLKQIDPQNSKFDPNFHTSVGVIDTMHRKEDNVVLSVVQKGYEMNGKVIRAAKVKVGRYKK